jgi:uncharacterized membrane protein
MGSGLVMAGATLPQQTTGETQDSEPDALTVGVLVAQDTSRTLADELAEELPDALREHFPGVNWRAEVSEVAPAEPTATSRELLATVRRHLLDKGWSLAVGLTGLPLLSGHRPVTAYASATESVGLVSIPALGAVGLRRRLANTVRHLVKGLLGESVRERAKRGGDGRHGRMGDRLRELCSPLGRARAHEDGTLRFVGAVLRGNLRLLVGMVRANEPATVITRLSGAMVGAFGSGTAALVSSNVWSLADALSWPRLLALASLSVMVTCVVLVVAHDLWERAPRPEARQRVVLFNLTTVTTLALGVVSLYVGLFVIFALVSGVFIPPAHLGHNLGHLAGVGDYVQLAWFSASIAIVGGALGSLVESDEAVRDAAYRSHHDQRIEEAAD